MLTPADPALAPLALRPDLLARGPDGKPASVWDVKWKPLYKAAESTGGVEYYLIEQEHAGPDGEIAMAQRCMNNYRKMQSS